MYESSQAAWRGISPAGLHLVRIRSAASTRTRTLCLLSFRSNYTPVHVVQCQVSQPEAYQTGIGFGDGLRILANGPVPLDLEFVASIFIALANEFIDATASQFKPRRSPPTKLRISSGITCARFVVWVCISENPNVLETVRFTNP